MPVSSKTNTALTAARALATGFTVLLRREGVLGEDEQVSVEIRHKEGAPELALVLPRTDCFDTFAYSTAIYYRRQLSADELTEISHRAWPEQFQPLIDYFCSNGNQETDARGLEQFIPKAIRSGRVESMSTRVNTLANEMQLPYRISYAPGNSRWEGPFRFFRLFEE